MPGGDVDKEQLMRYINLEREIQNLEAKNILKTYEVSANAVKDLLETIKSVEHTLDQQKKQTQKEKDDVDKTLRNMFADESTYQKVLSKEQEEYLEACNKMQVTAQQLEGLRKQRAELEAKLNEVKEPAERLKKCYEERDDLLSTIFDGEYGSDEENKLEAQFDVLMEKQQRISVAFTKWRNARILLQHAFSQLQHAVAKWDAVGKTDPRNMQQRYTLATEVRNNLIAAMQNVNSTQRYLSSITFPYCKPEEMTTLNRATNNIYTDMQCHERICHAGQCYSVTMKRAGALLQWFDSVIQGTIQKDLATATAEASRVEQALRAERIRLIREKVEESGESTKDLNIEDFTAGLKGAAGFSAVDQQKMTEADMEGIGIARPEGAGDDPNIQGMQQLCVDEDMRPPPTPIPLNELAPNPSAEELFGDIEGLKKQHKKNQEDFMKAQEMNKVRMEQGLQEKLQARRTRKRVY